MKHEHHTQILPDHLSDETAAQMVELLYTIAQSLENRYFAQIRRYYQNNNPTPPDFQD